VQAKDSALVYLWKDQWLSQALKLSSPELFSFVKKKNITLKKALSCNFTYLFHLPLSEQAYEQLLQVQNFLQTSQFLR
jgi:hypothetical protein